MNRKILVTVLALALLMMLTFTASLVAASVEKVPVKATQIGAAAVISPESGINEGGILHVYATAAGTVDLGNDGTIDFASSSILMIIFNTKTGEGVIHFDMKWAKMSGTTEIGAFDGQVNGKITACLFNPDAPSGSPKLAWVGTVHAVFQGSGVFEGQTLMLDGTRGPGFPPPPTPLKWEGLLLKH